MMFIESMQPSVFADRGALYRRSCALAPFVGLVAALLLLGFGRLRFDQPVSLSGDHIFLLQMIKDAMRGIGVFNEHMGAPLQKNSFYMPFFDGSYKFTIWLLTRFTSNVFVAVSLFYLIGVTATFATSFWSLRVLEVEPWLASVASVAFVLTPYFATRAFSHDLLSLYYSVPLGAGLAVSFSQGEPDRKAGSAFALVSLAVVGTGGLYYAFFSVMFISLILVARAVNDRSTRPLVVWSLICTVVLLLLGFSAYGFHVWRWLLGGQGLVTPPRRYSWEQLSHGLLIGTALHVYADIGLFAGKFAEYKGVIFGQRGMGELPGESYLFEWPGPFLTTIILISPGLLFCFLNTRARRTGAIAVSVAFITFGLLFSIRGGLGYVFGYLFTGAIRAQERIIPFLTFFAILVACLGTACIGRRRLRRAVVAITMLGLVIGMYPAIGLVSHHQNAFLTSPEAQAYRQSVLNVLAARDRSGITTIFQLPVMQWPESPPVGKLVGYEHALPYIFDRNDSTTRWSYGLSAAQIAPFAAIATQEPNMPGELKKLGFDGILVEKTGYSVERAASLVNTLEANGACLSYQDQFRALFSLCK
jgi:phosphoglycerol transferase